jgi:hypothetical protein
LEDVLSRELRPFFLFLQQDHTILPEFCGTGVEPFATAAALTISIAADLPLDGELVHLGYQRSSPSMRSHVVVELPNLSTIINWRQRIVMGQTSRAAS